MKLKAPLFLLALALAMTHSQAWAQWNPVAEIGDAVFRDYTFAFVNVGHAAIYQGFFARSGGGENRHSVIQATGDGYTVGSVLFDYGSQPTFMGSYSAFRSRTSSNLSPPTWDGSSSTMTSSRRNTILTEAKRLYGIGYTFTEGIWTPAREPRNNDPVPDRIRCDGVVVWAYERSGLNTGSRLGTYSPYARSDRMLSASENVPTLGVANENSYSSPTITLTSTDGSSKPEYLGLNCRSYDGSYSSPRTIQKSDGMIGVFPIDYAGNSGSIATYTFHPTTASAGSGGSLSPSGSGFMLNDRQTIFTANPSSGYQIDKWTLNGQVQTISGNSMFVTPGGSSRQHTVSVTFLGRIIGLDGDLAFGSISVGGSDTRTFTIRNTGNSPLAVSSIDYPSGFRGSWSGGTIAAGGSRAVTVTFSPAAAREYGGTITVQSDRTGGGNTIACSGTGLEDITRIIRLEGRLDFASVNIGESDSRTLAIFNDGNRALSVTSISYPEGFSGSWNGTVPAGGSQNVTVTFSPQAERTYGGTVTVNGNSTDGLNTIACSGTGMDNRTRIIRLSGDLAFGDVTVGQSATRTFTIHNDGNATLNILGMTFPARFAGNFETGTVPGGGSHAVTVTFSPNAAQPYSGAVDIESDCTSGSETIRCSGRGTAVSALSINPQSRTHSSAAAAGQTLAVTATADWTATRGATDPWITITGGSSGNGNGTVTYAVAANTGSARRGTITIRGGGLQETFTVSQDAGSQGLRILTPNGGEHWEKGSAQRITWRTTGREGPFTLELHDESGAMGGAYATLAQDIPDTGEFMWTIPEDLPAGSAYRIFLHRSANGVIVEGDESDGTFSLTEPAGNAGEIVIGARTYTAAEGRAQTITVRRQNGSAGSAAVSYITKAKSAAAWKDFKPKHGLLTWLDGDASAKQVKIAILADNKAEGNEVFQFILKNAVGAALGSPAKVKITIAANTKSFAEKPDAEAARMDRLGKALDGHGLTWFTSSRFPWSAAPVADAAVSGGNRSWLETDVEGPGRLTFNWSGAEGTTCLLFVDGRGALQAGVTWTSESVELGPGNHAVRWVAIGSGLLGKAYLDRVTWTAAGE